jgi:hypothetical protein
MQSELITALQSTNQEIRSTVSRLSETNVASLYAAFPPGELQALNGRLARMAARLGQLPADQHREAAPVSALREYLSNLDSLKTVLARVQVTLAKQRDHLKKDLSHMNSARAWVEAFRATSSA